MARKHSKQGVVRQPVERTLIQKGSTERKVVENPTTKQFEVVTVETPAVYKQGKAYGPTTKRGEKNEPANMAPRGKAGVKQ